MCSDLQYICHRCCSAVSNANICSIAGSAGSTQGVHQILRCQSATEENHHEEERGNRRKYASVRLFRNVKCYYINFYVFLPAQAYHGWAQCADEEHQTSLPGRAALLLPDYWQAVLCSRLCQRWRGEFKPHNAPKISPEYWSMFGRDVDRCLSVFSPAVLPSPEREDLPGAQSQVLRCWNCKCTWLPPLPAHCVQVMTDPTLPPSVFSVDMTCAEHGSNYFFFFFTGTWSLRTSCWTHRATLSSQTLDSAKKVSRPITQQQPSAGRLRYKTNLQTFKQPHYQYRNYSCWTVGWLSLVAFLTVFGSWGSPEAGVRPHSRLVVSGIGALRDALWTCKWNVWLCASW